MVGGRMTVDQAAAETDRRADAILEKRRWMMQQAKTVAPVVPAARPAPAAKVAP
jgi:multiple sugar transport system substrate-binding protein